MAERYDVIIVGGAVAGATLANALGQRGVRTILIEKLARERHGARGDVMHPPALRALQSLDLLDPLYRDGALRMEWIAVTDARSGMLAKYPMPSRGDGVADRSIAVPHDRIEAVLYECAGAWPSVTLARGIVVGLRRRPDGRVVGVRYRPGDSGTEDEIEGRLVVGCDGTNSMVRREIGVGADVHDYTRDLMFLECEGTIEPSAALHYHVDDQGLACVVARPRGASRAFFTIKRGQVPVRGPDPALREYLVGRFQTFAPLHISRANSYVYRVSNVLARRFGVPGAALAGDAAHTTHPVGATGMSLAIIGVLRLIESIVPPLESSAPDAVLDDAVLAYDALRRPAAGEALLATQSQAQRMYESDLHMDGRRFAEAVDPAASWTAHGGGYGQDPAGESRRN